MDYEKNNHKLKAGIQLDASTKKPYRNRKVNGVNRKVFLTHYDGATKTKSDFASDCDVNRIMANYRQGGNPPNLINTKGVYGDFSQLPDFQGSLDLVNQAQTEFNALNSNTRNFFENNPQKLVDFLSDENNRDKAIELGLINPPAKVSPPSPSSGGEETPKTEPVEEK